MAYILYMLGLALAAQGIAQGQHRAAPADPGSHYFQGQPEKALAAYLKSYEGGEPAAAAEAAAVLRELGRNGEALSLLERASSAHPGSAEIKASLAWAVLASGDYARASGLFSALTAGPGEDRRARLGLAMARMKAGEKKAAAESFGALSADPALSPLASYFQGLLAQDRGDHGAALKFFNKSLKDDSHFVEVRPLLASIYERQGRADDAWRQYAKMSLMDPRHKVAAEKKQSLLAALTKKPEEILAPRKIPRFTGVQPAPDRGAAPELRVGIGTTSGGNPSWRDRVDFRVSGEFSVLDTATGKELAAGKAGSSWTVRVSSSSGAGPAVISSSGVARTFSGGVRIKAREPGRATVIIETIPYAPGMSWSGVADKELRGDVEILLKPGSGLYLVNRLPLEEYLYGVLAAEMPVHWPPEALKAQAVIARSYAAYLLRTLRPHSGHGYDLCDEQHCQVYSGLAAESAKARAAVDGTRGRVLAHKGRPVHAVFSSNCGGETQSGSGAGWSDMPYWKAVADGEGEGPAFTGPLSLYKFLSGAPQVFCRSSKYTWAPEFRWTRYIPAAELEERLSRRGAVGELRRIALSRGRSGRVAEVEFAGAAGSVKLRKEHEIRRIFGLAPLRSSLFFADVLYEGGAVKGVLLTGGGWGHGVGLCQSGAAGRAEAGQTYESILPAYYSGAELADLKDLK